MTNKQQPTGVDNKKYNFLGKVDGKYMAEEIMEPGQIGYIRFDHEKGDLRIDPFPEIEVSPELASTLTVGDVLEVGVNCRYFTGIGTVKKLETMLICPHTQSPCITGFCLKGGTCSYLEVAKHDKAPLSKQSGVEGEKEDYVDFQEQVRQHIRNDKLYNWDEALTDEEMLCLEQLLLTFNPKLPPGTLGNPSTAIGQDGWIKCEDEKPEHKQLVLVYGIFLPAGRSPSTYKARFYKGDEYNKESFITSPTGGYEIDHVTHWKPLPKPPVQ